MKTPLHKIEIASIYKKNKHKVLLPKRMAYATPDTKYSILGIAKDIKKLGGKLILSDLFRSYDMQYQANLDYVTGKKKAYSPPPGGSLHEAGRAFDISLKDIKMELSQFWDIANKWGVSPIISRPNKSTSEAWHFECRGSHQVVYDYYKNQNATNLTPYKAMAISSILAIGVKVKKFKKNQKEAYIQSMLIRLGFNIGNIDGIIGIKTKEVISEGNFSNKNLKKLILELESHLETKYTKEFYDNTLYNSDFDSNIPQELF